MADAARLSSCAVCAWAGRASITDKETAASIAILVVGTFIVTLLLLPRDSGVARCWMPNRGEGARLARLERADVVEPVIRERGEQRPAGPGAREQRDSARRHGRPRLPASQISN